MRVVLQRVTAASVSVDDVVVALLGSPPAGSASVVEAGAQAPLGETVQGLVALVGVTHDDGPAQVDLIARKIADLRILDDERGAAETGSPVLVVSQFTLYADTRKGRRPSWNAAAPGPVAEPVVDALAEALRARGIEVRTGRFGADMAVALINDGPVTILLEA